MSMMTTTVSKLIAIVALVATADANLANLRMGNHIETEINKIFGMNEPDFISEGRSDRQLKDYRSRSRELKPKLDSAKKKIGDLVAGGTLPRSNTDLNEDVNEFNFGVPDEIPEEVSQKDEFDDDIWSAAMEMKDDRPTELDDVPTFEWPESYSMFTTIDLHNEAGGTSIINTGTIDLDYIVEVDEDKALIYPYVWNVELDDNNNTDNPVFLFPMEGCDDGSPDNFSFMIAYYIGNIDPDAEKEILCFQSPQGTLIESVGPATISKVIQLIDSVNEDASWDYAGTTSIWFYNDLEPVELFVKNDPINPIVVALNATDHRPIYLQVRYDGLFVRMRFWSFQDPTGALDILSPILNDQYCDEIPDDGFYFTAGGELESSFFEVCPGEVNPDMLKLGIEEDLEKLVSGRKRPGTGHRKRPGTRRRMQEDDYESPYDSARKPYKMVGNAEDKYMLEKLMWFVPSMNGRRYLPVRNQGNCGSCWAVAAAHSISSVYANENPGELLMFSYQHIINCISINATYPIVAGCFAGWVENAFDWLVYNNRMLPVLSDIPYIAFQAGCNRDFENLVDTGIKGYAQLKREARIKDALYFRGDVVVSLKSSPLFEWEPSENVTWSNANGGEGDPMVNETHLGEGVSGLWTDDEIDHAVVIIGWGSCTVQHCLTDALVEAQCWIVQNSWGKSNGFHGYYFVHTDRMCDLGISKYPYIPLIAGMP